MLHLSAAVRYYFYAQKVDMRKGCYGLCGIVQNEMKQNVLSGDVFAFINKKNNLIKLLQWDKDGFIVYEKRLEKGTFEKPEKLSDEAAISIGNVALQHILQGIILQSVRHKKRFAFA